MEAEARFATLLESGMFVRHDELMTWHLVVCSSGCFHAAGALQYDFEAGVARDLTARRGMAKS